VRETPGKRSRQSFCRQSFSARPRPALTPPNSFLVLVRDHKLSDATRNLIPVIIVADVYRKLNLWNANCGASFEWVGRAINPYLGFMTGWLMITGSLVGAVSGVVILARQFWPSSTTPPPAPGRILLSPPRSSC
jgi:hypothetical protein